jgi:hypothetical protein
MFSLSLYSSSLPILCRAPRRKTHDKPTVSRSVPWYLRLTKDLNINCFWCFLLFRVSSIACLVCSLLVVFNYLRDCFSNHFKDFSVPFCASRQPVPAESFFMQPGPEASSTPAWRRAAAEARDSVGEWPSSSSSQRAGSGGGAVPL